MRFLPRLSLVLLMACLAVLAHAVEDAGLLALPSGTPAPFNPMNVTIPEGASDQFTVFSRSDLTLNNGHNQASFAALNKFYNTDRNGNSIFNNIPAPQVDGKAVRLLAQEFGGGGGYMDFTDDYVKFGSTANLTLKQTNPTQVRLSVSSGDNNVIQVAKLRSGSLSDFETSKSPVSSYFPDLSDTISRDKICLARIYSDPSTKTLSVQNGSIAGWDPNNINVLDYNDLSRYSRNNRVNFNYTPATNSILIIKVSAGTTRVEPKMHGMNAQHEKVPYVFWDLSEVTGDVYFDGFDIGALYAPYANVTVNLAPTWGSNGSFLANELEFLGGSGDEIHGVSFAGFPARFNCTGSSSSGIDLQAFRGADGVYVEFVAYDVEEDGDITLFLMGPDGKPVWDDSVAVEAGGDFICRFLVPGLEAGRAYNFALQDEVGKFWEAWNVPVKPFAADMISMSLAGVTLSFESLPEREYAILWTPRLGAPWQTVKYVFTDDTRTAVVVPYPDRSAPSGFFRIVLQ